MWIGCDAGLYRYDGFTFKHYYSSQQNGRAISFLQLDTKQRIWCKNFYGQIYRVSGDSLSIMYSEPTSKPEKPHFTLDEENRCWLTSETQIKSVSDNGVLLDSISPTSTKINGEIISLTCSSSTLYWLTSDLELYSFDINTKISKKIQAIQKPINTTFSAKLFFHQGLLNVHLTYENKQSMLYVLKNNQLTLYFTIPQVDNNFRVYYTLSDENKLWITTSHGAFYLTKDYILSQTFFPNEKISSVFKDREGQYWFTNLHEGINVIPSIDVMVYSAENSELKENNLSVVKSTGLNDLHLGSALGNFYQLSLNTSKKSLQLKYENETENFITVKAIKHYKNYTLISRGRLCIIDTLTQQQYFPKLSNVRDLEVVNDTVYLVFPDFISKVALLDLISNREINYVKIKSIGGKSIEYNSIHKVLYLSLSEGTFTYSLKTNTWKELLLNGSSIFSTSLQNCDSICWMATLSNGVVGFNNEEVNYHLTTENGLKENTIKTIACSGKMLWIASDNFLHRVALTSSDWAYFNYSHGIYAKDINSIDVVNNTVYLATNKGLVYFPVHLNWKNEVKPSLAITSIFVNNQSLKLTNFLQLNHDFNNLKINFISTAFKSKGKFQYAYRILELDTNYIKVEGSTPYAIVSSIPPGMYSFQVKAINESGVESDLLNIKIEVNEPYYKKWWFYLLVIITMAVLFWVVFYFRVRFIRNKAELRNKMISSQLTALKSQMNPHFMFNTLNSLQDLILKNDIKSTNYYLSKYGMLMRRILEYSEKNEILLSEEMELMDTYLQLEKLRFGDDFHFEIKADEEIQADLIAVPPMIIQPFVENAIKHGLLHKKGIKELRIHFTMSNQLICTIDDNGVGRKKSAEINAKFHSKHQSFATQATEKRIELLNSGNQKIFSFEIIDKMENVVASGTRVIIKIPLGSK